MANLLAAVADIHIQQEEHYHSLESRLCLADEWKSNIHSLLALSVSFLGEISGP